MNFLHHIPWELKVVFLCLSHLIAFGLGQEWIARMTLRRLKKDKSD